LQKDKKYCIIEEDFGAAVNDMVMFRTIRQTAANGLLNEHRLRQMHKESRLPGFYSGNRFMVDQIELEKMLHSESARTVNAE
jgi:hypothetical protein